MISLEDTVERVTNWAQFWQELVEAQGWHGRPKVDGKPDDVWRQRARRYDANVKSRWARPDSSREYIASQIDGQSSVLDIGAGTGSWTVFLAKQVGSVTAVDPSPAMIEVMSDNVAEEGLTNVEIVQGAWPEVTVEPHDFSLCSHAMYGHADLPAFVRAMEHATRQTCFMVLRVPTMDGVMAEASRVIRGHPHDSPNFTVAYNVLLEMGICPNVLMEDTGLWDPWVSASLEDALADVKRRLALEASAEYDDYLRDLLGRRLTKCDDGYAWPRGVRSVLVYWDAPKK
jgi:FkbM family methyltransferase